MSGAFARRTVDLVRARRQQATCPTLRLEMLACSREGRRELERAKLKIERAERKEGAR